MTVTYVEEPVAAPRHAFIIGGCHIAGVGIGENPPFWRVVTDWWNADEIETSGHLTIPKAYDMLQRRVTLPSGSLFILQLGHFDSWQAFSRVSPIRKKNFSGFRPASIATDKKNYDPVFKNSLTHLSRKAAEGILGWAFDRLTIRDKEIDAAKRKISDEFDKLAKFLNYSSPKAVIVLSTFPTVSIRINHNRLIMNQILKYYANIHGFTYINVWEEIKSSLLTVNFPARSLILDSVHLNANGHDIVGKVIIKKLKEIFY